MQNVSVAPMSRKRIREFALEIRKSLGFKEIYEFPIVEFIEWYLPKMGLEYEIKPVCEMNDTYGLTNTGNATLCLREDVYEGAVRGNPRDRFTLCHELGHFLLHTPDRVSFARGDIPTYCNAEWQANTFAGEILAPYNLVCCMTPDEIACKCKMSYQAATIQYQSCRK